MYGSGLYWERHLFLLCTFFTQFVGTVNNDELCMSVCTNNSYQSSTVYENILQVSWKWQHGP